MMYLLSAEHRSHEFSAEMEAMFRLRYRVFKERLHWDVETQDGMERDRFDGLNPVYLLYRGDDGTIGGCVRLLPTLGPNMLRDSFSILLDGEPAPEKPEIWESSRFSLDANPTKRSPVGLSPATHELFAGMIEFGLAWGLTHIVTVTDARVERILRRAGWPLERLGSSHEIGNILTIAGFLETSERALKRVREISGLTSPVLWVPVPLPKAA